MQKARLAGFIHQTRGGTVLHKDGWKFDYRDNLVLT
jgi:hypothetical protein